MVSTNFGGHHFKSRAEISLPNQRRAYSKSVKAQVVEERAQPGASIADAALSHDFNTYLAHKWIRRQQAQLPAIRSCFIPLPLAPSLPATPSAADMAIQIAIPYRAGKLPVLWPGNDPEGCARFLCELLK